MKKGLILIAAVAISTGASAKPSTLFDCVAKDDSAKTIELKSDCMPGLIEKGPMFVRARDAVLKQADLDFNSRAMATIKHYPKESRTEIIAFRSQE
jgi:hypothetical protein